MPSLIPLAAKEAGACFYVLPEELKPENVDELIRDTVLTINRSGWVWTGESCQGHPDLVSPSRHYGWEHNTKPMLRLITSAEDFGLMMRLLTEACWREIEEQDEFNLMYPSGLEVWPQLRDGWWTKPYKEVLVYVPAVNTIQRNAGLRVFERFAENVVEYGEARRHEANAKPLTERVADARAALGEGDEAVAKFLRGDES